MNSKIERETVVELCIELSNLGYFSGTGGNIALRIDAERLAVTPSATDYLTMTASDVCVLRLSDLKQIEGERAPSVESGMHARLLRARPDANCSIHTHQPIASACALLGRDLEVPPGALRFSLGRHVPIVGYAPSGSAWLSSKLGGKLRGDTNAYLMFDHGVMCCGASARGALRAVHDLEALAKSHLMRHIAMRAAQDPSLQKILGRVADLLADEPHPELKTYETL